MGLADYSTTQGSINRGQKPEVDGAVSMSLNPTRRINRFFSVRAILYLCVRFYAPPNLGSTYECSVFNNK